MRDKFYYIVTYGCQMNVHESEKIAGILSNLGYLQAINEKSADIIVFNTCCIRETAETRFLGNLGNIKNLKEKNPDLIVAVCGCMPQNNGGKERIQKKYPEINIMLGTHNIHLLHDYILSAQKKVVDIWENEDQINETIKPFRTSGINAWVNIMYGCNNFCSYCIVPYVRGRERSRNLKEIVSDVKNLVANGYKEITLLGQNVNSYGSDLDDGQSFPNLLRKIDSIDGQFRIRYMTSHPKDFSLDTIKAVADCEKVGRLIHLPVQSGSDRILSLMNRKYTSSQYLDKVELIRKYIPESGLSSDIIVGFPSETDEDFEKTVDFVKTIRYNNLYTYMYSRRSGTAADKMAEQIDIKIKRARISKLIDTQFEIKSSLSAQIVGKKVEVLTEGYANGYSYGKTSCGKSVKFRTESDITGNFIDVLITSSKNSNLIGSVTN